ncbi:TPR repeat-containing protein [Sideroxydans lithotrophicus ES-1]|uniref:protein O-GlcNAc transferase n=2 Tax=Sideroxydans TaxID=314343 RepID=D5CN05_SIDLE|nr:TPR repeat-containing protein [Sideroxydans lithotrophicus ES-1]
MSKEMTARFPQYGIGWKMLGVLFNQMGRNAEALGPMRNAITLLPNDAEAHGNLGIILNGLGMLDEAAASYRRAIQLNPNVAGWYFNLGNIFMAQGKWQKSEDCYQCVLMLKADFPEVYNNLGIIRKAMGQPVEAEACYRRAIEIRPNYADAYNNLGSVLQYLGRPVEAEVSYKHAIQLEPARAESYSNLGNTLQELGRYHEAEASLRRALQLQPDHAQAYNNLGGTLKHMGRLQEAESCYRRALHISPEKAEVHSNLGATLMDMGRLHEAEQCYREALRINPEYFPAHSNLLFMMNYASNSNPEIGLAEAKFYGMKVSSKASAKFRDWSCNRQAKRLRIGFVSGDFRQHPIGYFLESVLKQIDPVSLELFAYPTYHAADEITARLQPRFAAWRPLCGMSDEDSARLIHGDGLHVLIDLSGHTQHNRLPVFAWKPAPIQVSWQGYLATTGVAEIDYFLADPYVAPIREAGHFTEEIWRLPECYMCFTEPAVALDVAPLPSLSTGCITFGSLNNLTKMSDATVALWAQILTAVPGSQLFLKTRLLSASEMRESVIRRYAQYGIPERRLILEGAGTLTRSEYLESYRHIDIALDPFPYAGCTTSIEGLWMGVPLLTKRGDRFESHLGETINCNAGLADWIAIDEDDYVAKAVNLSSDPERLASLRAGLRHQVLSSPLFDAPRFARNFEQALRGMWGRWLER